MNKTAMIKKLVALANDLDAKGLTKEANEVDALIRKMAYDPADKAPGALLQTMGPRNETNEAITSWMAGLQNANNRGLAAINACMKRDHISVDRINEVKAKIQSINSKINEALKELNQLSFYGV